MKKRLKDVDDGIIEIKEESRYTSALMDGFIFIHTYYELVDKDGALVLITDSKRTAMSMAHRYNLNWRAVNSTFKYVKEKQDENQ